MLALIRPSWLVVPPMIVKPLIGQADAHVEERRGACPTLALEYPADTQAAELHR